MSKIEKFEDLICGKSPELLFKKFMELHRMDFSVKILD